MRRACSSDVSRFAPQSVPASLAAVTDGRARARSISRATAGGTRPSIGSPRATRARSSLEETSSARSRRRSPGRGARAARAPLEALPRVAGAGRDAEPRQLEHPVGLLPGRGSRRTGRRRSGRAGRRSPAARAGCRSCARAGRGDLSPGKGGPREREPRRGAASSTSLCPGPRRRATTSRSNPKRRVARARSATWPACGGSNAPPSRPVTGLARASRSPTATSSPSRAPAAAQRLGELLVVRRRADDAEAAVGAQDAGTSAPRLRPVDEELRHARSSAARLGPARRDRARRASA